MELAEDVSRLKGGFECSFVETPAELQYECAICLSILRDPHLVDCCGYSFCSTCIQPILSDHKPCPLCKKKSFNIISDKRLGRDLGQKDVYCSKKDVGCNWVGKLVKLDAHINAKPTKKSRFNGCIHVDLRCMHCGNILQRGKLKSHEDTCPKRPLTCEYCHVFSDTKDKLEGEHYPKCNYYPLECTNECGEKFARWKLESHLINDCPCTPVNCDFHYAGCDLWMMRKDLALHLKREALKHSSLLAEENVSLILELHKAKEKYNHFQTELDNTMTCYKEIANENFSLLDENKQLKEQAVDSDHELGSLFKDIKDKTWELQNTKAQQQESEELLQVCQRELSQSKEIYESKDSILKVCEMELSEALSLLEDFSKTQKALNDKLAKREKQQETLTKRIEEKDTLQTELLLKIEKLEQAKENFEEYELPKRNRLIEEQEVKLMSFLDKSRTRKREGSTGAVWPDFDPYDEEAAESETDQFYPYTTYTDRNKLSSTSLLTDSTDTDSNSPAVPQVKKQLPLQMTPTPQTPLQHPMAAATGKLKSQSLPPKAMNFKEALTRSPPRKPTSSTTATIHTPPLTKKSPPTTMGVKLSPPPQAFKIMIRNTPSMKRGVKDSDIIQLFENYGRVLKIVRQGSNTAVFYADKQSARKALSRSKSGDIVCNRVELNCTL